MRCQLRHISAPHVGTCHFVLLCFFFFSCSIIEAADLRNPAGSCMFYVCVVLPHSRFHKPGQTRKTVRNARKKKSASHCRWSLQHRRRVTAQRKWLAAADTSGGRDGHLPASTTERCCSSSKLNFLVQPWQKPPSRSPEKHLTCLTVTRAAPP